MELRERLLARSEVVDGGCRRWLGAHVPKGYGQIVVDGKRIGVHRAAHTAWIGPVPEGFEVDHVRERGCRHRDCIEPRHLEAVTHAENVARVPKATSCPNGHDLSPENVKWYRTSKGYRGRKCRRCFNDRRRGSQRRG